MQILFTPRLGLEFMQPMISHPRLKDGVEARAYQLDAAKECLSGSTLLVMPTGLGKTAVQWMAMAENLEGDGKIVLVAPTTGLVAQQASMAKDFIDIDEDLNEEKLEKIIDQINKNQKPKPGSYRGRLSSEPENIRKTLLGNKNA